MTALFTDVGPPTLGLDASGDFGVRATAYCRGPWDDHTLHGGPVAALLAAGTEARLTGVLDPAGVDGSPSSVLAARSHDEWLCSRLTVDLLSAVPLGALDVSTDIVKVGGRTALIDAALWAHDPRDGSVRKVARSSAQWVRRFPDADVRDDLACPPSPTSERDGLPGRRGVPARPEDNDRFVYPRPGFNVDACELEYLSGSHETPGPASSWIRLRVPVFEGVELTPFTRMAAVSDLSAAAGWDETPAGGNYINPDLTLQLERMPQGEWLGVRATTRHGDGAALLAADWYDDDGPIGTVSQSLVVAPRTL